MAEKEDEPTPAEDIVVTKYKMAGDMVNGILKEVIAKCVDGASVLSVCQFGDARLIEETGKVFKKDKEMKKGIAFPTCVSVNNCICHFSPLKSDPDVTMKVGDVVKIDLGAHIDGFIAVVAHTLIVGASEENKVTGRKADLMMAANTAAEIALRMVKPGAENYTVTDGIQRVAESFNCKPIEGMLSHQLKKNVIDGEKAIIQNPSENQRKDHEKCEFDVHEVYGIDVLISTGEGKGRESDTRTTVFKKKDIVYQLKMKASRQFLSETEKKFGLMPFTLRLFDEEVKARMGVVECVKHDLVQPFNVLYEKPGEYVAQFKFTVILMPNGPLKITGLPFNADLYQSECKVEDEELKIRILLVRFLHNHHNPAYCKYLQGFQESVVECDAYKVCELLSQSVLNKESELATFTKALLASSASRKAAKKKKKRAGKAVAEQAEGGVEMEA